MDLPGILAGTDENFEVVKKCVTDCIERPETAVVALFTPELGNKGQVSVGD